MQKYGYFLILLFTVVTGFYLVSAWQLLPVGSPFVYPIDDAYIHLAISKNFANYGVWSINTSGFDSASSSILYTLLLSLFIKIFGNNLYIPLVINLLFGYLTIYSVYRYFKDFYGVAELKWSIFLLLPFTLLYASVISGMEQTLHLFLMVLLMYFIKMNEKHQFFGKNFYVLLMMVFLLSMVRFESMFLTVSLAFALVLRRNFWQSAMVLLVGFLPIVLFGLISIENGGFFFPNSVLMKGSYPENQHFLVSFFHLIKEGIFLNPSFYKCLFFPLLMMFILYTKKYQKSNFGFFINSETLLITIVATGLLHSIFAILKFRYENYLMLAFLLMIIPIITDFFKNFKTEKFLRKWEMLIGIFGVIAVSVYRFQFMHVPLLVSSKNVAEQQVEMARFLHKNYQKQKVLANDIGAISYFGDVQLLDMVGLGSTKITKIQLKSKSLSTEDFQNEYKNFLTNYTKENNYKVAVIYPQWFPNQIPDTWIRVASCTISENRGTALPTVVFYACNASEKQKLVEALQNFDLNKNVKLKFLTHF